ncbi:sirohydrochlorin chelatase [Lysinibacillus fusiformis]
MQAILYIAHGSRVKAGTDQAIAFLQGVQQEVHVSIQEICFLELATPTIAEGIAKCVRQGATMIAVMPILLLAAQHAKQDIPREIAEAQKLYTHIQFSYGEPLGIHERIIDTLQARIVEKQQPNCEASVLLIGRGSSDLTVKRDLAEIATRLRMKYNYQTVDTCFLYGMGPSFDDWLQQEKERQHQVFIVPYLLFTGILRQSITKRLQGLSNNNMMLCESLGYDVNVKKVLVERIDELLHFKEEGVS